MHAHQGVAIQYCSKNWYWVLLSHNVAYRVPETNQWAAARLQVVQPPHEDPTHDVQVTKMELTIWLWLLAACLNPILHHRVYFPLTSQVFTKSVTEVLGGGPVRVSSQIPELITAVIKIKPNARLLHEITVLNCFVKVK